MSRTRGFTLLSLLAVMAVMAVLSAILFPRIAQTPDKPSAPISAEGPVTDVASSDV